MSQKKDNSGTFPVADVVFRSDCTAGSNASAGSGAHAAASGLVGFARPSCHILDNLGDAVFWIDAEGRFIEVNKAACRSLGYSSAELLQLTVADIDPNYPQDIWPEKLARLRQQGEVVRESQHERKDGSLFPVELCASHLHTEGLESICVVARDISARKQLEDELLRNNKRLSEAQKLAQLGHFQIDLCTGEGYWSEEVCHLLGYKFGEPLPRYESFMHQVAPADRDRLQGAYRSLRESGQSYCEEFRFIRNDGVQRTMLAVGERASVDPGQPDVHRGTLQDITDRKQHQLLQLFETRLLDLLNNPVDLAETMGELLNEIQETTGFTALGVRLKEGTDYPYLATLGLSDDFVAAASSLFSDSSDSDNHPGCLCASVISGAQVGPPGFFTPKGSFWTNSASQLLKCLNDEDALSRMHSHCQAEGYESIGLFPLCAGGQTLGLLHVNDSSAGKFTAQMVSVLERTAVTIGLAVDRFYSIDAERRARKLSDSVVQASLKFLETNNIKAMADLVVSHAVTLTGAAFGGLFGCRGDKIDLLAVSDMAWQGTEHEELFGPIRASLEVDGRYELEMGENLLTAAVRGGRPILSNRPQQHAAWADTLPSGHPSLNSFLAVPVISGQEVVGMIAVANGRDGFTSREQQVLEAFAGSVALALQAVRIENERHKVESQLLQSRKMDALGRLAGGVAHDFNNMLSVIIGFTEIAQKRITEGDPLSGDLQQVMMAAERSEALAKQLLAFSRQQPVLPLVMNVNGELKRARLMLGRLLREELTLTSNFQDGIWNIRLDRAQFDQMLVNLVVNARDAITGVGEIVLETRNVFLDSILGDLPMDLPDGDYVMVSVKDNGHGMPEGVKEQAFEPFFSTKDPGRGTGLGLSMVYGVVRQNKGFIDIQTRAGVGTEVRVYFPRCLDEVTVTAGKDHSRACLEESGTVLLVEDEVPLLHLLESILEHLGFEVLACRTPQEALFHSRSCTAPVRLLLTDVVMPGMNGRELAEALTIENPGMKTLFMSGYPTDFVTGRGVWLRGDNFIGKPFKSKDLQEKVRLLLSAEN